MFGSNYFGQPYFGQGYAGEVGAQTHLLSGSIEGVGTAVADLLRNLHLLAASVSGAADADGNLSRIGVPTGRVQFYDYDVTFEDN